jgi:glycosyltransferase involved in cell wall biosynthesis
MLEAQLCGLAIVTTDRHGESSYIVNGENGFVSNDMEALLAHVRFLGEHPQELQRIGANGRTTAQRIFGSERFLAEWEALLAEAVSGAQLSAIAGAGEVSTCEEPTRYANASVREYVDCASPW